MSENYRFNPFIDNSICRDIFQLTDYREVVSNPRLIVATDMEGPLVIGDTALELMSDYVRPENADENSPDYGAIIFGATYDWYTQKTLGQRKTNASMLDGKLDISDNAVADFPFSQEGTDIALALALLLAKGVTKNDIKKAAQNAKLTPGASEWIEYVKENNGLIVGITTAWQPVADVVQEMTGIHGAVGTPFPIDEVRGYLEEQRELENSVNLVNSFLDKCFSLIDVMENHSEEEEKSKVYQNLVSTIDNFYENQLCICYSAEERKNINREQPLLGQIIESIISVGDRSKAALAHKLFRINSSTDTLTITIGDGLNDCHMLRSAGYLSIGFNGMATAQAAQIGIIGKADALVPVIDFMLNNVGIEPLELIEEVQGRLPKGAIIHLGGALEKVPTETLERHKDMKKKIRGPIGTQDFNV